MKAGFGGLCLSVNPCAPAWMRQPAPPESSELLQVQPGQEGTFRGVVAEAQNWE